MGIVTVDTKYGPIDVTIDGDKPTTQEVFKLDDIRFNTKKYLSEGFVVTPFIHIYVYALINLWVNMYIYIKLLILLFFRILTLPPDVCNISFGPPPLILPSILRLLISPLTKKSDDTRPPEVLAFRSTRI